MASAPKFAVSDIAAERPDQYTAVEALHRLAFGGPLEAMVVAGLRQSAHFIPGWSLAASQDGQVVGHVLFSRVWLRGSDRRQRPAALLAPLAVHPQWAGQGVGSALVRAGLTLLKEQEEALVVVRGHPKYYQRLGFESADSVGVFPPPPLPGTEYSALWLTAVRTDPLTLSYPLAFAVLGYPVESE